MRETHLTNSKLGNARRVRSKGAGEGVAHEGWRIGRVGSDVSRIMDEGGGGEMAVARWARMRGSELGRFDRPTWDGASVVGLRAVEGLIDSNRPSVVAASTHWGRCRSSWLRSGDLMFELDDEDVVLGVLLCRGYSWRKRMRLSLSLGIGRTS